MSGRRVGTMAVFALVLLGVLLALPASLPMAAPAPGVTVERAAMPGGVVPHARFLGVVDGCRLYEVEAGFYVLAFDPKSTGCAAVAAVKP